MPAEEAIVFRDRKQAAEALAQALGAWAGREPLVLAIPRGAVPMARLIAQRLGGEFDVVLVRKLGAPGNPEFAIGAVEESGWAFVSPWAAEAGASAEYVERVRAAELATLRARRADYSPLRAARDPARREVIVVDDGLATGATMIAALHAIRARGPARLVCAVPVAAPGAVAEVAKHCDEVLCLLTPPNFQAVGQFYADFRQVSDEEVIAALRD
jgi:predicted phosphoribosyltransferase